MARIVSLSPPDAGKAHRMDSGECLIGRRADCQICVPDQRVSRRHARIRREPDGLEIEDLGSSNGTYVNGRRAQGALKLSHGDEVEIGGARFRIDLGDEAPSTTNETVAILEGAGVETISAAIDITALRRELLSQKKSRLKSDVDPLHELERMRRKLQAMYRIAEMVASTFDPEQLMDRTVSLLLDVLPQSVAAVAVTFDPRTQKLRTLASRRRKSPEIIQAPLSIPQSVVDRVIRQGHSVLLKAPASDGQLIGTETMVIKNPLLHALAEGVAPSVGEAVGWRMGAPLSFRGEHLGILHVEAEASLGYFTQDDLDLIGGIAAQAGMALHGISQHHKMLARQRLDYDLSLARQIQRNLLPRELPKVAGIEFAVHYEPAFQVGGDFYDFLWLDAKNLAIEVGDVSGKAISGALFMGRVISEVRAVAPINSAPRTLLQRVNSTLTEVAEDGMFVTMVYLTLDLERQVMRMANAGHTTPLLRRAGAVIPLEFEEARTLPMGVEERIEVQEAEVKLQPGDVLAFYTDGIIEARSVSGEFYGQERFEKSFGAAPAGARRVLDALLADLDLFVGQAAQADDQTVVCLAFSRPTSIRMDTIVPGSKLAR